MLEGFLGCSLGMLTEGFFWGKILGVLVECFFYYYYLFFIIYFFPPQVKVWECLEGFLLGVWDCFKCFLG